MFKSGDKVVFCKSSLDSGMIDAKEGDVFTIKECLGPGCRVFSLKELPGYYHNTHFELYVEKDKVMEKYIPKVGDKVKGFKFYGYCYPDIGYAESMNDVIGEQGTVYSVSEGRFVIDFGDNRWTYPLELAHLAKIEESSQEISHEDSQIDWQVGQEVFCLLRGKGVVVRAGDNDGAPYVVGVDFGYTFDNYTIDGKIYDDHKGRVLFFSEPKIIAERMPPKKTFVPTLKFDDKVIVIDEFGRVVRYGYVEKESEDSVSMRSGEIFHKVYFSFHELGEQVKFS